MNRIRRAAAGVTAGMMVALTCFSHLPVLPVHGAVTFGELEYQEELVEKWDALAEKAGLERTDMQNHYTSTYPKPKVIASVKQQTGKSAGGNWKGWEYRNVYCISHSGEAANNPVSSMVCSSVWYAGEPWTLQNLPPYMSVQAGGDADRLRFNFLMLAYGAAYHAEQDGVNSDPIAGTADYYLCQGICTLTEDLQFTGDYEGDWQLYEPVVMDWASRFHPNGHGDSRVYEEMKKNAKDLFDRVWHTAKLMAACTQSSDDGFVFQPQVFLENDGMFHAKFPVTPEIRPILAASVIRTQGDWQYQVKEDAVDFWSSSGEIPACGYLAEIDPLYANGIIYESIGEQSVRKLQQPVQVRGVWSMTYAQTNLVSSLVKGTKIKIGTLQTQGPSVSFGDSRGGNVRRYRHTECWQADYAVMLRKRDAETGQPLEGAQFDILEAFDSSQLDGSILEDDNWENSRGSQFLRWEGWDAPYEELGDEPCQKDQEITDEDGWLTEMESAGAGPLRAGEKKAHHDVKYYTYTKGYCGGHPEPDPEEEDEVEEYEREIAVCEALVAEGGFFHSLDGAADQLRADRDLHYQEFISLTYDYSAKELTAREGYLLHNQETVHEPQETVFDGIHRDTIPVETVTIHASQYAEQKGRGLEVIEEVPVPKGRQEELDAYIPDEDEATPSDATASDATGSNAARRILPGKVFTVGEGKRTRKTAAGISMRAGSAVRDGIRWRTSDIDVIPKGDTEYGGAGAAWIFELYDHRTEGEIHINKRDLVLKRGECEEYDSYGDTQGDTTLEGAVYGLFAAEDILHPDGKTGVVYQKGNLTAVAATDRNGDASFLVYTEAPGSVYDYGQGKVISTEFSGPGNLYVADYEQQSSNEDFWNGKRWSYPICNLEQKNGNCWIGRPLMMGSYYVQELTRSEGYELSVQGVDAEITNRMAWENREEVCTRGEIHLESMEEQILHDETSGKEYLSTQLTFEGKNLVHGYDVILKGLDPRMIPSFYSTKVGNREVFAQWKEPLVSYETIEAEPGSKVIIDGGFVEAEAGDEIALPNGERVTVEYVEKCPVNGSTDILTGEKGFIPTYDQKYIPDLTEVIYSNESEFVEGCNEAFAEIGLLPAGKEAPYLLVALGDEIEEWSFHLYTYLQETLCPSFNAATLERVIRRDDHSYAVLRYSFLKEGNPQKVLYSAGDQTFYVKYDMDYRDPETNEVTKGYLYHGYPVEQLEEQDFEIGNRLYQWIRIDRERPELSEVQLYAPLSELSYVSAQEFCSYWVYGPGDLLRNEDGSIYRKEEFSYEIRDGYHTETSYQDTPLQAVYKEAEQSYVIHIAPERISEDGTMMISIRYEDVFAGNRSGLSVSAYPSVDVTGTYIRPVVLVYPGQEQKVADAGTRVQPLTVEERAIVQKVQVQKTVEALEQDSTQAIGNFRFKIYLKSNLERLYRDEDGNIVWQSRDGQEQSEKEQREKNRIYPGLVPVIDTKKSDPEEKAKYVRLLDDDGYDKFFAAVAAANHDKWDDAEPTYTSWHPIGNHVKRSQESLDNVRVSDAVRQFAINWYLDREVEKKGKETVTYTDEFYDQALSEAIQKARDYLKPFYRYDLDEVYAILWDSDPDGGRDGDWSTLSADMWQETFCSGTSVYLPYGIYVVVELQPHVDALGDFRNKHYQIDTPKEIVLPSVYEADETSQGDLLQKYYQYDAMTSTEQMERNYQIRFQEEDRVVEAHTDAGDFSVFPYGKQGEHKGFLDGKPTMTGIRTAYNGVYAPMLVPWSMVDQGVEVGEHCVRVSFHNRKYKTRFRLEKLDSQTHENLLHDRAVFRIYKAKREENSDGSGEVLFYEEPSMIIGSKEFLTAMKAEDIRPAKRKESVWQRLFPDQTGPGNLYTGIVAAGTPMCEEKDLVESDSMTQTQECGNQTVGYLVTSQILDAGTYVICEVKPPEGYVRSDPIAVEVYSDKVAYYKEGKRNQKVLAVCFEAGEEARIYVENEPICLQVEKKKESSSTVTYRVEGDLEYLCARKDAGEEIEIAYEGKAFAGYGYVTRERSITDEENPYVSGAQMTLFQALELKPTGDSEDYAYEGLVIERNASNQVVRMYVKENDTDILYFPLDSLSVTERCRINGQETDCGYDRRGRKIPLAQIESDRQLYGRTDTEHSIYVFRKGILYLEIAGGDFTKVSYSRKDKILSLGEETRVYHLDRDGSRDALIDPYTGMAYVLEESGSVLVWPVQVHRDAFGNVTARDKIRTSRIATIGENQNGYYEKEILEVENPPGVSVSMSEWPQYEHVESGYLTGSWASETNQNSHREESLKTTSDGKNQNDEPLLNQNEGSFTPDMYPEYDEHGRSIFYIRSEGGYEKGTALYDRNGDFVRYQDSDLLEAYNQASYQPQESSTLHDAQANQEQPLRTPLYHRLGESYVLENTWVTSDQTPNDPFQEMQTEGQPDLLKRIPEGCYIMEEIRSPEGFLKGMPVGIRVKEQAELQATAMIDKTTKAEFGKMDPNTFGNRMVEDAELALFQAERVSTADLKNYPNGYYLQKKSAQPYLQWRTGVLPFYTEQLPAGNYLLVEQTVPSGFVEAKPLEVVIENTAEVQSFILHEDHTKVEIEKYEQVGTKRQCLSGAEFTLYPALLDDQGKCQYVDGLPQYQSDSPLDSWTTSDALLYRNFIPAFEAMYRDYGAMNDTELYWEYEGANHYARTIEIECSEEGTQYPVYAVMVMRTDDGKDIRIHIYGEHEKRIGTDFEFEYQFEYQKIPQINDYAYSWLTLEGMHRLEYLPSGSSYVLVETSAPDGYARAANRLIEVRDTADVQRHSVENQTGKLIISKRSSVTDGELAGAHLALYRADEKGDLNLQKEYLVTDWISGSDGFYTEQDDYFGLIPDDYQAGDWKPHEIRRLKRGDYWIVELESPPYYQAAEPVKIHYDQETAIQWIQIENSPVNGSLSVRKTDQSGNRLLKGAVFEVRAFRTGSTVPVLIRSLSDFDGVLSVADLPVGEIDEKGNVIPYHYTLQEILAPDGYAVGKECYRWIFDENQAMTEYTIPNSLTKISIGKKMFHNFGMTGPEAWVAGAGLAVFEIQGRDGQGCPVYDWEHPLAMWVTDGTESSYDVEGLVAGRSYLLKEWYVPDGYYAMPPIIFTLSTDGCGISGLSDEVHTIGVHTESDAQKVTIAGRCIQKTIYELENQDGEPLMTWTGTGTELWINRDQAEQLKIAEGELCRITEKICFTDGTCMVTSRMTRRLFFLDESSTAQIWMPSRKVVGIKMTLEAEDRTWKRVWYPDQNQTEFSVEISADEHNVFVLAEELMFSDGTQQESYKLGFDLGEPEAIRQLNVADRQTEVRILKTDVSGKQYLPGNCLRILNQARETVEDWISENGPYVLTGVLKKNQSYILEEICQTEGFTRAEDIPFTLGEEGVAEQIWMVNHVKEKQETPKPGGGSGGSDGGNHGNFVNPEILEFPAEQKKIGTISAAYQPKPIQGGGETGLWERNPWLRFLPDLGDERDPMILECLFLLSLAGILWCRRRMVS